MMLKLGNLRTKGDIMYYQAKKIIRVKFDTLACLFECMMCILCTILVKKNPFPTLEDIFESEE